MEYDVTIGKFMEEAHQRACEIGYEYVTPELLLLVMFESEMFRNTEAQNPEINLEPVRESMRSYLEKYVEKYPGAEPSLSSGMTMLLSLSSSICINSGNSVMHVSHIMHAYWNLDNCYASECLREMDFTELDLLQPIMEQEEMEEAEEGSWMDTEPTEEAVTDQSWQMYAPCLNDTLKDANPLIGREEELERTIQILCRKDKNNPIHIGEAGVGKTAITYGLVEKIRKGDVPDALKGSRVFALDMGGMLAGTQYRGDFEKRFKHVLDMISREDKPIIYIDEIHTLSGAGAVEGSAMDASNMLKPYLSDGHIRFIGASTFQESRRYFEKNTSLARRFQRVEIAEPSEEETVEILNGLKDTYEEYHGVHYDPEALTYAVHMSREHIHERFLPDKAIDLMDEAGAFRKLHPELGMVVDREVMAHVLTKICRVPMETVESDDREGLATLKSRIQAQVYGQDEAVEQVVNAIKFSRAGLLEENKPLASLLFVGPTGVGKTEVARVLARELGVQLVRFDMSEYGEKHAVAKLIGSPAGYVGYEDGGLLTEEIRKHPSSVLLLDEIEKAHPDIYNVLLQVMDYATLTDNQGRKADFRHVVIIMTSNAGASQLGRKGIGFDQTVKDERVLTEEVKRTFQPEFRNRLNRIVRFNSMDDEMALRIVDRKLRELAELLEKQNIRLTVQDTARQLVREKGISQAFGAREVDRVIRNEIKSLFVDSMLFGDLSGGGEIMLSAEAGQFVMEAHKA